MPSGADSPVFFTQRSGVKKMTPPDRSLPALPGRSPSRRRRDRPADQPPDSDCSMRRGPGWAGASDQTARVADRRSGPRAAPPLGFWFSPRTPTRSGRPAGDAKPVSAPPVPGSGSGGALPPGPDPRRSALVAVRDGVRGGLYRFSVPLLPKRENGRGCGFARFVLLRVAYPSDPLTPLTP